MFEYMGICTNISKQSVNWPKMWMKNDQRYIIGSTQRVFEPTL